LLTLDTSFAGDTAKSLFGDLPMNRPASVAQGIAQASADPNLNGMGLSQYANVRKNILGYGGSFD
jgi:hypothetical protein